MNTMIIRLALLRQEADDKGTVTQKFNSLKEMLIRQAIERCIDLRSIGIRRSMDNVLKTRMEDS